MNEEYHPFDIPITDEEFEEMLRRSEETSRQDKERENNA